EAVAGETGAAADAPAGEPEALGDRAQRPAGDAIEGGAAAIGANLELDAAAAELAAGSQARGAGGPVGNGDVGRPGAAPVAFAGAGGRAHQPAARGVDVAGEAAE